MRPIFATSLLAVLLATPVSATPLFEPSETLAQADGLPPASAQSESSLDQDDWSEGIDIYAELIKEIKVAKKAEQSWRLAIQQSPTNAEAHLNLANALNTLGRYQDAEAIYQRAIELAPQNRAAYLAYRQFLQTQFRLRDTVALYRRMAKAMPKSAIAQIELAYSLRQISTDAESQDSAIEAAYRKAISLDSHRVESYQLLSSLLAQQNRLAEAIASLREIIRLEPDNSQAYQSLAKLVEQTAGPAAAAAVYQEAIAAQPKNLEAYTDFAFWLLNKGRSQEAEAVFQKAVKQIPENQGLYIEFGKFFAYGEHPEKAEAIYQAAIDLGVANEYIYIRLGDLLVRQDRSAEGRAVYEQAISLSAEGYAQSKLAGVLEDSGQVEDAIALYKQTIQQFPDESNLYYQLGQLLERQNRPDEAIATYRQTLTFDNGLENTEALAALLIDHQQYAEALDIYQRLGLGFGNDSQTLGNWKIALRATGQSAAADSLESELQDRFSLERLSLGTEAFWREAIAIAPESGHFHYKLGQLLANQDRAAEAEAAFQKALQLNNDPFITNVKLGKSLFDQGEFDLAEAAYEVALKQYPKKDHQVFYLDAFNLYQQLGDLYQTTSRFELALAAYQKAADIGSYQGEDELFRKIARLKTQLGITETSSETAPSID